MNLKHAFFRCLAIYVAVSLCSLTPLAGIGRAEAAIGVKSLVIGGLVGGAALLALGALTGPAGVIGSVGAAGTGFSGLLGGAVGGVVGGTAGAYSGLGMLGSVACGLAGMFLGAHFLAPILTGISPWILVPAVLIGGGLLVYSFLNRRQSIGTVYDNRSGALFNDPTWNAGSRVANQSQTGSTTNQTSIGGSFLDSVRSIFDRNRRDDQAWWDQRYVDANGYVRYNPDIWGKLDRFFNGRNSGVAATDSLAYGIGYGNTQVIDPSASVRTDQAGRVVTSGVGPQAPESAEAVADESLQAAEARRQAAYENLVTLLKEKGEKKAQTAGESVTVPTEAGLQDPEVLQAVREYREADRELKELTKRLQPQEKQ